MVDPGGLRETIETIPVLICFALILRYTKPPQRPQLHWAWRTLFLVAPFSLLTLANLDFPPSVFENKMLMVAAAWEAAMVGVAEELTFRFGLQRLWARYGASFFVIVSTLIFGLLHLEDSVGVAIFSAICGLMFALARVAGMPIVVLIIIHGLLDLPGMIDRIAP